MLSRERMLAAIVECSEYAVMAIGLDGKILVWNDAAASLYGYPADEIVGKPWIEVLVPPADRERCTAKHARYSGQAHAQMETTHLRRDGEPLDVALTTSSVLDDDGRLVAVAVLVQDIRGQRRAEATRRAEQHWLEESQALAKVGSWVVEFGNNELRWSAQSLRNLGVDDRSPIDLPTFFTMVHPEDRDAVQRAGPALAEEGVPFDLEHRIVRQDGVIRWMHSKSTSSRSSSDTAVCWSTT